MHTHNLINVNKFMPINIRLKKIEVTLYFSIQLVTKYYFGMFPSPLHNNSNVETVFCLRFIRSADDRLFNHLF